jgi:hypothetical protein
MEKTGEFGPIYEVPLINSLPCGGMAQAMPNRADLNQARKRCERVAAGYEVLLAHYQGAIDEIDHAIDALDPAMARYEIVRLREQLIAFRSAKTNGQ